MTKRQLKIPLNLSKVHSVLKTSFGKIREEMDDHREAINENTNEIQSTHSSLSEMDKRLTKMEEKLDELVMMVSHSMPNKEIVLDDDQSKVFLVLYTNAEEGLPLSQQDIARKANMPEFKVRSILEQIFAKGIPIIPQEHNSLTFYELDKTFAAHHAKNNIVKLQSSISVNVE